MAIFLGFAMLTFTSCKQDGCTDITADNYDPDANNDDGTCVYSGCTDQGAENYNANATIDDGSCIYARDKFIGAYNVNENCTSGNFTYSLTITPSTTTTDAMVISNFGGYGVNVRATVSGANISFNDTQDGVTFSGTGNISGNTLTIIYTASAAGQTDNCTKTCIKQ